MLRTYCRYVVVSLLLTFNVCADRSIDRRVEYVLYVRREARTDLTSDQLPASDPTSDLYSDLRPPTLRIPHSTFHIPHSAFRIPHPTLRPLTDPPTDRTHISPP